MIILALNIKKGHKKDTKLIDENGITNYVKEDNSTAILLN
jgi:hypothetical protein